MDSSRLKELMKQRKMPASSQPIIEKKPTSSKTEELLKLVSETPTISLPPPPPPLKKEKAKDEEMKVKKEKVEKEKVKKEKVKKEKVKKEEEEDEDEEESVDSEAEEELELGPILLEKKDKIADTDIFDETKVPKKFLELSAPKKVIGDETNKKRYKIKALDMFKGGKAKGNETKLLARANQIDESYRTYVRRPQANFAKARRVKNQANLPIYDLGEYLGLNVYWNPRTRVIIWGSRQFLWSRKVPKEVGEDLNPEGQSNQTLPHKIIPASEHASDDLIISLDFAIRTIKWKSNLYTLTLKLQNIMEGDGEGANKSLCREVYEMASTKIFTKSGIKEGQPSVEQIITNLDAIRFEAFQKCEESFDTKRHDWLIACQKVFNDALKAYNSSRINKFDKRRLAQNESIKALLRRLTAKQFYQRIDMDADDDEEREPDINTTTLDTGRRIANTYKGADFTETGYRKATPQALAAFQAKLKSVPVLPEELRRTEQLQSHLMRANQLQNDPRAKKYDIYNPTRYTPGTYGHDVY